MDLAHLSDLDGADNNGGVQVTVYVCPVADFTSLKALKTGAAIVTPTDAVTIDGDHTFALTKGFYKFYGTLDTGELKMEKIGERDARTNKLTLDFWHPGSSKEAALVERRVKNIPCIVLVKDADGNCFQMGSAGLPAEVMGSFGTGKVSSGRKGWDFKAESFANSLYYYDGVITENTNP